MHVIPILELSLVLIPTIFVVMFGWKHNVSNGLYSNLGMFMRLSLVGVLLVGNPSPSLAKTYKFRDENGKLHFTNDPEKVPEKYRKDSDKKPSQSNSSKSGTSQAKVYEKNCVHSKNKSTALHGAAATNNVKEAELAILNGSDLEAMSSSCYTALHIAAYKNNFEVAEFLLSKGANPNVVGSNNWAMPLTSALNIHKIKLVKLLLNYGADVNATTVRNKSTPLIYAIKFNGVQMVKLLIDNGADVNFKNEKGLTALKVAREKGDQNIVDLLVNHGAKD